MISLVHLSNSFIKNIITHNFKEKNDSLIYFLNEIIKNSSVYFVGSKTSLKKKLKENLSILKTNSFRTNFQILYFIEKKVEWLDLNLDNCKVPIDFYFTAIGDIGKKENYYTIDKIISDSNIILEKIEKINSEIFNIKLLKGQNDYTYNKIEIEIFKKKILKVLNISHKITIWDQYIPDNLATIDKRYQKKTIKVGKYNNDYCNTLKFLEDEIFAKSNKKINCEILTMNKLETDWDYKKLDLDKPFIKLAQDYVDQLKKTNAKLLIKNYAIDYWDLQHSRVFVFKDEFNQLISYCIFEPGADFIKKQHKSNYGSQYRVRNYKFTPGNKTNFDSVNSIMQILSKLKGRELSNSIQN